MARTDWIKFYPADWNSDADLRACSLKAIGFYSLLLHVLLRNSYVGHLPLATEQVLHKLLGVDARLCNSCMRELKENGVLKKDKSGGYYSARIVRDQREREKAQVFGRQGGNPDLVKGGVKPRVKGGVKLDIDIDIERDIVGTEAARLSELLFSLILRNNPKAKKPNLKNWSQSIDRMMRLDDRDPQEIETVIRWCQDDEFWCTNILSADKLRKQYDQLCLKMNRNLKKVKGCRLSDPDHRYAYGDNHLRECGCDLCMKALEKRKAGE